MQVAESPIGSQPPSDCPPHRLLNAREGSGKACASSQGSPAPQPPSQDGAVLTIQPEPWAPFRLQGLQSCWGSRLRARGEAA